MLSQFAAIWNIISHKNPFDPTLPSLPNKKYSQIWAATVNKIFSQYGKSYLVLKTGRRLCLKQSEKTPSKKATRRLNAFSPLRRTL